MISERPILWSCQGMLRNKGHLRRALWVSISTHKAQGVLQSRLGKPEERPRNGKHSQFRAQHMAQRTEHMQSMGVYSGNKGRPA